MLPGRLRKTSLWSPLGHLKMRCSCLTLVSCEDKELSAVSARQTDVFHAALRVLTFRQRSLQEATCGRDVMISFSFACYHKHAMLWHWIQFFFFFYNTHSHLNMEDSFLLHLCVIAIALRLPGTGDDARNIIDAGHQWHYMGPVCSSNQ